MSEVIKTSKRFFDNDIAEKSDQLDTYSFKHVMDIILNQ